MSTNEQSTGFFRCPVHPDQGKGWLKVGRRRMPVSVVDTSIEGFTLTVSHKLAKRLRHDRRWVLTLNGERSLVHPEWMFNAPNGDAQLGVRRVEDLTPPPQVGRSWFFSSSGSGSDSDGGKSGMALGGVVMLLIAMICLPGIGDDLGTAPALRAMIGDTFSNLESLYANSSTPDQDSTPAATVKSKGIWIA